LEDEEVGKLKVSLYGNPEAGVLIPRHKGLRKLRWAAKGKGKRAGARVIYYYVSGPAEVTLLSIYSKNSKTDLSENEYKRLRKEI
jgi:mRNA-degrading endonuclease RelE of RelBE toxin-antitoxin system